MASSKSLAVGGSTVTVRRSRRSSRPWIHSGGMTVGKGASCSITASGNSVRRLNRAAVSLFSILRSVSRPRRATTRPRICWAAGSGSSRMLTRSPSWARSLAGTVTIWESRGSSGTALQPQACFCRWAGIGSGLRESTLHHPGPGPAVEGQAGHLGQHPVAVDGAVALRASPPGGRAPARFCAPTGRRKPTGPFRVAQVGGLEGLGIAVARRSRRLRAGSALGRRGPARSPLLALAPGECRGSGTEAACF